MHSIKTKVTLLTVIALSVALAIAAVLGTIAVKNLGHESSNQILSLLCETGQKNLNAYFESVEQSVETVYAYAESDLAATELDDLAKHLERVEKVFENTANHTASILTYYYRIDPKVSGEKGFWYVNLDGTGFVPHEVTDITLYDTEDQSALVWFTVPKATGRSIWLSPYYTDNLDVYVLSYNVPVYKGGTFIGVIGIEIDYNVIVEPVDSITLYGNGYAFINDDEGNIIYHPHMNIAELTSGNMPKVPEGLLDESGYIEYKYEGVEKQAVWLPLENGMRLNVTVPLSEINASWSHLISRIVMVSLILIVVFAAVTMHLAGKITRPLRKLTKVAEQVDAGNYDYIPTYDKDDEIGTLAKTVSNLVGHLKVYIDDLNSIAYADALTWVHNKGSFDIYLREMQSRMDTSDETFEFAVGIFDCDDLKVINDSHGHDKGDLYLKTASSLICKVFSHSPVFRIGGDEFAIILRNEDYTNRKELAREFAERSDAMCAKAGEDWECVKVAFGIAVYEPKLDRSIEEVVRRADALMYENKRERKAKKE